MSELSGFIHRFERGADDAPYTILVLHGTGGDENDLLGVAHSISPKAHLLSPRGPVIENGMPRFFRRFAEGVFDVEDIKLRAGQLAQFVQTAAEKYEFDRKRVIAFGYSNGANIALSMMLLHPTILAGAILLRPMYTIDPPDHPNLQEKKVLIEAGIRDSMGNATNIAALQRLFSELGAQVEITQQEAGHELTQNDLSDAERWLSVNWP
jgi:phospholipase/carboxylesterase